MGEDFGTVNVRKSDRSRELEVLRQHYRSHRDSLASLAENAPTDFLATEYQRLISEIDAALGKLEELDGHGEGEAARPKTQPGTRPIVHSPAVGASAGDNASAPRTYVSSPNPASTGSRMMVMVIAGVLVLGLIGWLIWRAGGDRQPATTTHVVEQPTTTQPVIDTAADTTIAPVTAAQPTPTVTTGTAAANSVTITPALADYGTVRKGTRATRQFQVVNTGTAAIQIKVARSSCRCFYYEYNDKLAPKKKESITVTIDGARAKPGTLAETIQITGKGGTPVLAQFQVQATVK